MNNDNNNYKALIYFTLGIFMYGAGFSSIFKLCGNLSYIVIIIGSIISTIIEKPYRYLIKNNNNIFKLLNILFILLISMMILRIFTTSFYLTKTPGLLITVPFIILCLYNANKGLNTLIKETNILFIFSITLTVLNLIAATKTGSIYYLIPNSSFSIKIIKGIIYYVIYMLSPLILFNNINISDKEYKKAFILTNIFLIFMSLIIIFVLGSKLIGFYRFPEYMIYKEISLFGFIENVENLVGLIYFLNLFVTSSFCIINLKEIIKNKYKIYILVGFILLLTEFVSNRYYVSMWIYKSLPIILILFIIINIILNKLKKE